MIATKMYVYHDPIIGTRRNGNGSKVSEKELNERIKALENQIVKLEEEKQAILDAVARGEDLDKNIKFD